MDFISEKFQQCIRRLSINIFPTLIHTISVLLSAPNTVPPDRLLFETLALSAAYIRMATSAVANAMQSLNLSSGPRKPLGPNRQEPVTLLDLPLDIKKRILTHNGDEQIIFHIFNHFDEETVFTIGRDPEHKDQPAAGSMMNLAYTCKTIYHQFFPGVNFTATGGDEKKAAILKMYEIAFRYAIVNVRLEEDVLAVADYLWKYKFLQHLPVMRLWQDTSFDATQVLLADCSAEDVSEFIEDLGEHWSNLERMDICPMTLPCEDDERYDRLNDRVDTVARDVWIHEQVRAADQLPCLAERKVENVIWRGFTWLSSEHMHNRAPSPPPRDEWGCTAADYEYNEEEDEYW